MDLSEDEREIRRLKVCRVRSFVGEKLRQQIEKNYVAANDVEEILRETGFYQNLEGILCKAKQ